MKYFIFITNNINANYYSNSNGNSNSNDNGSINFCRFMIPVSDINIYHSTVGSNNTNSLSNSFLPTNLFAWAYFVINTNNNSTSSSNDANEVIDLLPELKTVNVTNDDINIIKNGLSRVIVSIESQVIEISSICRVSDTSDERDNNQIKIIDDDFVRAYQCTLRCLQDCYHILSLLIQVLLLLLLLLLLP